METLVRWLPVSEEPWVYRSQFVTGVGCALYGLWQGMLWWANGDVWDAVGKTVSTFVLFLFGTFAFGYVADCFDVSRKLRAARRLDNERLMQQRWVMEQQIPAQMWTPPKKLMRVEHDPVKCGCGEAELKAVFTDDAGRPYFTHTLSPR